MFINLLKLLRPQQWIKNVFVFAPIIFGGHLLELRYWQICLLVLAAFSFASSAIYCLNDIMDVESDRLHSIKKYRPIALGSISRTGGFIAMISCLILSVVFMFMLPFHVFLVVSTYILINIAYCLWLKRIAVVDVMTIAFGYVLRIVAGGWATDIWVSQWIVLMTFLLTLFLALAKRRDDILIYERTGERLRGSVEKYNTTFINTSLAVTASITMVCYIMYSVSSEVIARIGSSYVYITSFFVLLALLRYLQITLVFEGSASPTKAIMKDVFIHIAVICWIISFMCLLYL